MAVMGSDAGLADWLTALRHDGVALIRDAPARAGEILRTAHRVAPPRGMNFGEIYNVISQREPNATAEDTDRAGAAYRPGELVLAARRPDAVLRRQCRHGRRL